MPLVTSMADPSVVSYQPTSLSNERLFPPMTAFASPKGCARELFKYNQLEIKYTLSIYDISSLVSIRFLLMYGSGVSEHARKPLQTLATIGEKHLPLHIYHV